MNDFNFLYMNSPLGRLRLLSDGQALTRIEFENQHREDGEQADDAVLLRAAEQLDEYFAGRRRRFSIPLAAAGTIFQRRVWDALGNIPFGELRSYRDIADAIGNRKAVRAVGAANGRNPVPIIVPCHRVVGSNGKLTGYAGGLSAKAALLQLEGMEL